MAFRRAAAAVVAIASIGCGEVQPYLRIEAGSPDGSIRFGDVVVGARAVATLTLNNDGRRPLVIASTAVDGAGEFTLEGPTNSEILPSSRAYLAVTFAPAEPREYVARVVVGSNAANGAQQTVSVSGRGVR